VRGVKKPSVAEGKEGGEGISSILKVTMPSRRLRPQGDFFEKEEKDSFITGQCSSLEVFTWGNIFYYGEEGESVILFP